MKQFLDDDFLLGNPVAQRLFHTVAKSLPVVDFHNHINAQHFAAGHTFKNMTELWVRNDPYKHRAMRMNGIAEKFITGTSTDEDKFNAWASTVPLTLGNPLFHWSCLELKRIFNIDEVLTEKNATSIWQRCNEKLQAEKMDASTIAQAFQAKIICTSEELLDNLDSHNAFNKATTLDIKLSPSLRCDTLLDLGPGTAGYCALLTERTGDKIQNLDDLQQVVVKLLDHFEDHGCVLADHALDAGFTFSLPAKQQADKIFLSLLQSVQGTPMELTQLRSHLLFFLAQEYSRRGWGMQLHIGAQRFTSSRLRLLVGPAGGYASIGRSCDIDSLIALLDGLEKRDSLPRTILYTLNPADNEAFACLSGSFVQDGVPGKVQFGPAWWYNDHAEGMRRQLTAVSSYGLLSRFVGMTTDSRSIMSLSRHEYFRRIFCNLVGEWVEQGELPCDWELLETLVSDVCYRNAAKWFIK